MRTGAAILCVLLALAIVGCRSAQDADDQTHAEPSPGETVEDPIIITDPSPPTPPAGHTTPHVAPSPPITAAPARLREMLESPDDGTRCDALRELGRIPGTDPTLLTSVLISDAPPIVRQAAARGLGDLKNRDAIPDLVRALDDDNLNVRVWAISALNNTLVDARFPYNANARREERLMRIDNIERQLRAAGLL